MSDNTKKKSCKRCHKLKPSDEFPKSAWTKDGRMGFCSGCWTKKMQLAAVGRKRPGVVKEEAVKEARVSPWKGKKRGPYGPRKPRTEQSVALAAANEALRASGHVRERFMVRADDGDVAEFHAEDKALRQAMEWKMDGHAVTVWRQCEFEMVLRIIG